ncbi:MAG: PhoH family protein [Pyrinomonadaceae bacterium]
MAVQALVQKQVSRIVLARPAVEAGEKLGFLPGDLQDKVDPYLRPLYDALFDLIEAERVTKMLSARHRSGSAGIHAWSRLTFAEPLSTPTGWRKMGDLQVGALVIGSDGKPTEVLGVFPQGERMVYRVTMTDGASALACASGNNLWAVSTASDKRRNKPLRVLQTREMLNNLPLFSSIPLRTAFAVRTGRLGFPSNSARTLFARIIARRRLHHGQNSAQRFCTADAELVSSLESALAGLPLSLRRKSAIDYAITNPAAKNGGGVVRNPLTQTLCELNLIRNVFGDEIHSRNLSLQQHRGQARNLARLIGY